MKKVTWLAVLTALVLMLGGIGIARAEIIPAYGEGQIGYSAAILCETITLRQEPGASSRAVGTLKYGDFIIVMDQSDGWAQICVTDDVDGGPIGWVNADYLAIDPDWYRTEERTTVYAWDDVSAPKVALLDADTTLPILAERGDWLIVSLRGAVGWINVG